MMRRSVRKRAGFDLDEVAPLDVVGNCFVPALFGAQFAVALQPVWRPSDGHQSSRSCSRCCAADANATVNDRVTRPLCSICSSHLSCVSPRTSQT